MKDAEDLAYAWNGDNCLAYQLVGRGGMDLVYLQGYLSNVLLNHDMPPLAQFLEELASFSRLIVTDRRGLGCSERFTPADTPPLELLSDDILAVLDAVESTRAVLFATGDCGPIACLFAATHPDRVSGLVLYGTIPSWRRSDDIWWGDTPEEIESSNRRIRDALGDGSWTRNVAPSIVKDAGALRWARRYERLSLTPGSVYYEGMKFADTDVSSILPAIHVPALVLHRDRDQYEPIEAGRYLARRIPDAVFTELKGRDHMPWAGDQRSVLAEVRRFVESVHSETMELDRVLTTILFTDIVGSTAQAAAMGDRAWRGVREQHDRLIRAQLARFRGREIKTLGDGFLAMFDGPARGVRCAASIVTAVQGLGIEIRAGLHTGEVELDGDDVSGLGVAIGARVGALAQPSEVLVSSTIKDLVAGSGLKFEEAGEHLLKGVPERWQLHRVVGG